MTWLLAGLFAGIVSGFVAWFISLFYDNLYAEALLNEVTTFAAFTALLTFLAAIAGVAIGRYLIDRNAPPVQRQRADGERADTDVFEAVRDDEPQTAAVGAETTSASREKERASRYRPDSAAPADSPARRVRRSPRRHGTQVRVVPELLAGMHVRDVHLDQRSASVPQHASRSATEVWVSAPALSTTGSSASAAA